MTRHVRAYIEQAPTCAGEELLLPEDEAVHLSRVLRIQAGAMIECLDGRGGCYTAECLEVNRARVSIRILTVHQSKHQTPELRIGVALGKGNKWEELIRPLTELGVHRLTPLISERTEGAFSPTKFEAKNIRWQKIAQEACKQSGNLWVPVFDRPVALSDLFNQIQLDENCWMGSLHTRSTKLEPKSTSKKVSLLIGPEGGWTDEEEQEAQNRGVSFFSLGSNALRLETAAVSALAVARQHLFC
jgi:16S rRNA (uracil1498-N3)-methyltransferase